MYLESINELLALFKGNAIGRHDDYLPQNGFLGRRMAVIWLRDVRIVRCAIPNRATLPIGAPIRDIGGAWRSRGRRSPLTQVSASEYNDFHLDPESDVAKFGDEDGVGRKERAF